VAAHACSVAPIVLHFGADHARPELAQSVVIFQAAPAAAQLDADPSRLVFREHFGWPASGSVARMDVGGPSGAYRMFILRS
jgi:hypothetical protein